MLFDYEFDWGVFRYLLSNQLPITFGFTGVNPPFFMLLISYSGFPKLQNDRDTNPERYSGYPANYGSNKKAPLASLHISLKSFEKEIQWGIWIAGSLKNLIFAPQTIFPTILKFVSLRMIIEKI